MAQRLLRRVDPEGYAGSRYRGRVPAAEFVGMDAELRSAVLERADAETLARVYRDVAGYESLRDSAERLVTAGLSDHDEVVRVLGEGS